MIKLSTVALVAALSGVTACTAQPPLVTQCSWPMKGSRGSGSALVGHEYGPQTTPVPLNSVQFTDSATTKRLSVQNLFASRSATGTIGVTARLISCSNASLSIRIRTSFMDSQEKPTEAASAWKSVYLQPHLTATYAEYSVSPDAANYLIEISPE